MRILFFIFGLVLISSKASAQLCINEFLSANVNGRMDEDNDFSGWIELFNSNDSVLDITGYGLTDDIAIPARWTFPPLRIPAKGHILVFASGKNRREVPMTFQTLIDKGDEWHYLIPSADIGTSWREAGFDDSGWSTGKSGFGYADEDDLTIVPNGTLSVFIRKEFTVSDISDLGRLILHADYDDGFVAYINGHEAARANMGSPGENFAFNQTATTIHEASMYSGGSPEQFEISNPDSILVQGTNVIAIQVHNNVATSSDLTLIPFLTIGLLSAGTSDISDFLTFSSKPGLHTNFLLDSTGRGFYLFRPDGILMDSAESVTLLNDVSYGRHTDGAPDWGFFGSPTPGAPNSGFAAEQVLADPVLYSPQGGKHITGLNVTLSAPNGVDSVYYTTDGSIPDKTDQLYTGPLGIDSSKVIRARVIKYNTIPGPVGSNTYVVSRDHDLPIVCLSTEPDNLWSTQSGIYAFGPNPRGDYPYFNANFWQNWERPVHFEFYDKQGIKRIDQGAGIKIFGAWSRACDQKSFALYARQMYGKGSFKVGFFSDKPVDKFESIILRNSGNDNMGLQFHDCFMTGLTRDMDIDRQAYQPVAVYLNGVYWGLLNLREKISEHYIAENHHVDADSVNLLEGGGNLVEGSNEEYYKITDYLNTKTTLQNENDYQWVQEKIDIDNFIQYQFTEIYLNNRDWPGNNIKFWNTTLPGSKWRWILYDTDFGFGIWNEYDYQLNTLEFALESNGPGWPNPPWSTLFLRRLLTNPEFRDNFIIQSCDRLNLDFHPDRVSADLDSLKGLYYKEMGYTFNRWWGTYDDWQRRISARKTYGLYRPGYCRTHMQNKFNLGNELEVKIDLSGKLAGSVKLNTIQVTSFPFTGIYFEDIPISLTAIPKSGYKFVRWEGSVNSTDATITYNMGNNGNFKAVFALATAEDMAVVINEINYNSSPDHDTKDWIELVNNGQTTVDLGGWMIIDSGPDSGYIFPSGTLLTPGEYIVICRNLKDFREFNPGLSNSIGELPFGLSSEGEKILLYDNDNRLIDAVNYQIFSPWPESANGTGATAELKKPSLDNTLGENWQAIATGGTPGKINSAYLPTRSEEPLITTAIVLECFPNPFRDYTTIRFTVPMEGRYRLEIADMQGRTVNLLTDEYLNPGTYWIDWKGTGRNNNMLEGGVYTVRLCSERAVETRKVIKLH